MIKRPGLTKKGLDQPTLNLNFLQGTLDPRITFTRASTATYFGADGKMKVAGVNEPRLSYDPLTLKPRGLLIESPRTNMVPFSTSIQTWGNVSDSQFTVVENPLSGEMDAVLVTMGAATGSSHFVGGSNGTFTEGLTYTNSVYLKAGTVDKVQVAYTSSRFTTYCYANFQLIGDGVILSTGIHAQNVTITNCGNGIYRASISAVCTGTGTGTGSSIVVAFISSDNSTRLPSMAGDSYSSFYMFSPQAEEGSYATSYIPVVGSGGATRAAESAYIGGSAFTAAINLTKGTFHVSSDADGDIAFLSAVFSLDNGGTAERLMWRRDIGANRGHWAKVSGNVVRFITTTANGSWGTPRMTAKAAVSYGPSDVVAMALNGTLVTRDSDASQAVAATALNIGASPSAYALNGHIQYLRYWPKQLTASRIQQLTQ